MVLQLLHSLNFVIVMFSYCQNCVDLHLEVIYDSDIPVYIITRFPCPPTVLAEWDVGLDRRLVWTATWPIPRRHD
jgi:hypothetical protein